MPAPIGTNPDLARWLNDLEAKVSGALTPLGPMLVFACLKAELPDPLVSLNRIARVTDTNILVASDGVHWINQHTGAPI